MMNDHGALKEVNKHKTLPVKAKKTIKSKNKDKPKRPLSAYNFFFQEERVKILKALSKESKYPAENNIPELYDETINALQKKPGRISFEQLGKIIGKRWKHISQERFLHCSMLAKADTKRYQREMSSYNQKKDMLTNEATQHQLPLYSQRPPFLPNHSNNYSAIPLTSSHPYGDPYASSYYTKQFKGKYENFSMLSVSQQSHSDYLTYQSYPTEQDLGYRYFHNFPRLSLSHPLEVSTYRNSTASQPFETYNRGKAVDIIGSKQGFRRTSSG